MFNFQSGTELAIFQDGLIARYNKGDYNLSPAEKGNLDNNDWVNMAAVMAPCNLVIRQYCLQDLFSKKKSNESKIAALLLRVSKDSIWLEGYSYWEYTLMALKPFADTFNSIPIKTFIIAADAFFAVTSYTGPDGKKWPAPYGDLRQVPLRSDLQKAPQVSTFSHDFFSKNNLVYKIQERNLGFNTHTPKTSELTINKGVPRYKDGKEFNWYVGYDKKYPNKVVEVLDTFNPVRFFSIFFK